MDFKKIIDECNASCSKVEMHQLLKTIHKHPVKVALEIGVHQGGSLEIWHRVFKPELLMGIEAYLGAINWPLIDTIKAKIICGLSQQPSVVKQVEILLKGRKIDFLFIDGDHSYLSAKHDFLDYKQFLSNGAIVVFHDIALTGKKWIKNHVEVNRAWDEIKKDYQYKEIDLIKKDDAATGFGILIYE